MKRLIEWLNHKITEEDIKKDLNHLLLRFAFMDNLLSKDEKIDFLQSFNTKVSAYINSLIKFYRQEQKNMQTHGRLALKLGIEVYKTHLRWGKETLKLVRRS